LAGLLVAVTAAKWAEKKVVRWVPVPADDWVARRAVQTVCWWDE